MKKGVPPAKSTIVLHIDKKEEVLFSCLQILETPDNHNSHVSLLSYHSYREKGTVNICILPPFPHSLKSFGCHIQWMSELSISQGM
jgi:hypothetical protein